MADLLLQEKVTTKNVFGVYMFISLYIDDFLGTSVYIVAVAKSLKQSFIPEIALVHLYF